MGKYKYKYKYKFRLSDMIPNAWFYKLKDMSKTTKKHSNQPHPPSTFASSAKPTSPAKPKPKQQQVIHHSRKSYYFTRELKNTALSNDPPRKSCSQKQKKNKRLGSKLAMSTSSSVSAGCRASVESVFTKSEDHLCSTTSSSIKSFSELDFHHDDHHHNEPLELQCDSVLATENSKDIIIDIDNSSSEKKKPFDSFSDIGLPRIITKPKSNKEEMREVKKINDNARKQQQPIKRRVSTITSPRVKLRINSPRIGNRKIKVSKRSTTTSSSSSTSLWESFAIVKSSFDPQRDFRESMVEMILENNIKASKDLEDLLACYLSLNADEYHELIIKVFKQIWFDDFDLTDIQSKVKIKV